LNPIGQKILGFLPQPNVPSSGSFYSQNNYAVQSIDQDSFYNLMLRFDHSFSDKHRIFFRHASKRPHGDPAHQRCERGRRGRSVAPETLERRLRAGLCRSSQADVHRKHSNIWNRYVEGSRGDPDVGHPPTELGFPASLVNQLSLPNLFGRYEFDNYQALGRYSSFNYTNTFAMNPTSP